MVRWRDPERLWREIVADVLGAPMSLTGTTEGAAAVLVLAVVVAGGTVGRVGVRGARLGHGRYRPCPAAGAYDSAYGVYRDLYPALRESLPASRGYSQAGSYGAPDRMIAQPRAVLDQWRRGEEDAP